MPSNLFGKQKKACDGSVWYQFVQVSSVQKPAAPSSNKTEHVDGHEQCIVGNQELSFRAVQPTVL